MRPRCAASSRSWVTTLPTTNPSAAHLTLKPEVRVSTPARAARVSGSAHPDAMADVLRSPRRQEAEHHHPAGDRSADEGAHEGGALKQVLVKQLFPP